MLSFTIGASSITIFLDGNINTIDRSHANFDNLLNELRIPPEQRDLDAIRSYTTVKKMIERFTNGRVTIRDMEVVFDGSPIADYLAQRMLAILDEGVDITPYANFMENVHANPATYVHNELFQWLEKGAMPITPDGHFIAFKKVRKDYKDCHTGNFDNSVGTILEMDRNYCDTNRRNHCSSGFHFCSPGYLKSFGGERVMVLKINPRDVTSIPNDYQFTKGRCCRYEVIAELSSQSDAYSEAWSKAVIDYENPAEFPIELVSNLLVPEAVEETCSAIENEMTDAGKCEGSVPNAVDDLLSEVTFVPATEPYRYQQTTPLPAVMTITEDVVFTTADNRSFSAEVVKAALEDASIRGAARNLGIQDSTLRGWKKKLGL